MKYFDSEWYKSKAQSQNSEEYYDFMKKNYQYYPEWYKKYNVLENGIFIFHDAMICEINEIDNNLIIEMIGMVDKFNKEYSLVIKNGRITEKPKEYEGFDVLADELYCTKEGIELHFLITDDDIDYTDNLTIAGDSIDIQYLVRSLSFRLKCAFYSKLNQLKKHNRMKNKINKKKKE